MSSGASLPHIPSAFHQSHENRILRESGLSVVITVFLSFSPPYPADLPVVPFAVVTRATSREPSNRKRMDAHPEGVCSVSSVSVIAIEAAFIVP